jgi:hypothetical protein
VDAQTDRAAGRQPGPESRTGTRPATACPKPAPRVPRPSRPLQRSGWVARSGKPKARHRTKGGRNTLPAKLAWIRTQRCDVCPSWPSEAHHDRPGGARATDKRVAPLCSRHHRTGDDSVQALGRQAFQAHHGIDLDARTRWWQERWEQEEGA